MSKREPFLMGADEEEIQMATPPEPAPAPAPTRMVRSPTEVSLDRTSVYNLDLITHVFSPDAFKKVPSSRQRINHFLHSPLGQAIIVVFVILDCLVVFAQLYVDLQKEKLELKHLELICHHNGSNTDEAKDLEVSIHGYEIAFESLHYTSMALISLFFVEVSFMKHNFSTFSIKF